MSKSYKNITKLDFADYAIIYQRQDTPSNKWYIRIKKDQGGYIIKSLKTENRDRALIIAKKRFKQFCVQGEKQKEKTALSLKVPRGACFEPSGLYEIRNKQTNKVYIGYSRNITRRWTQHRSALNKGKHKNSKLQRSWSKWGHWNFSWDIIELYKPKPDPTMWEHQVFTETLKKRELARITKAIRNGNKLYNKLN